MVRIEGGVLTPLAPVLRDYSLLWPMTTGGNVKDCIPCKAVCHMHVHACTLPHACACTLYNVHKLYMGRECVETFVN